MLLASCGSIDPCENTVLSKSSSPDGKKEAIVFERGCGATTSESTQVSIASKGSLFLERPTRWSSTAGGNVLVVEDAGSGSSEPVEAHWASSQRLIVTHGPGSTVFKQESSVLGVVVEHQERNPK